MNRLPTVLAASIGVITLMGGCSGPSPAMSPTQTATTQAPRASSTPTGGGATGTPSHLPSPTAIPATPTSAAPSAAPTIAPTPGQGSTPRDVVSTIPGPLPEDVTDAPTPAPVEPDPSCAITQADIDPLYGAFDRVVNAVGREDQGDYTGALVDMVVDLRADSDRCALPEKIATMEGLARSIDSAAQAGNADLDAINRFRQVGNDWLDALGLRPSLLS